MLETPSSQEAIDPLETLPVRLGQVLAFAGINQAEFARRVGASSGFVSDVLRGVKRPGLEMLRGLQHAFGVSIDWLLSGEGTMTGGGGIQHDLFRSIRLKIAVARAAVIDQDVTAQALLVLIRDGQLVAVAREPAFQVLLDRVAPEEDGDVDLAVQLYNGHQWATDPISQHRNLLAAVIAHFEARKPVDRLANLAGPVGGASDTSSRIQINTGKKQRNIQGNYYEGGKR